MPTRAAATAKVATLLMRVAVISDVHANYHALEAVLNEIDAARVDAVWCLGDTVGYGPRPNECCDLVSDRADYCLVGNHDLVVLGELTVNEFNDEAAAAAIWTAEVLTSESRTFLASLKPLGEVDGVDLFHASARDPVWEYVLTEEAASATLELSSAPLVLVGHSHVALAITADDGRRRRRARTRADRRSHSTAETTAQPRLRRTAPRRRSPRSVAAARFRGKVC